MPYIIFIRAGMGTNLRGSEAKPGETPEEALQRLGENAKTRDQALHSGFASDLRSMNKGTKQMKDHIDRLYDNEPKAIMQMEIPMYFDESKILEHEIKAGTDQLIAKSAVTSANEPFLAIAQLLLAAATLAKAAGNSKREFTTAFKLAVRETYE